MLRQVLMNLEYPLQAANFNLVEERPSDFPQAPRGRNCPRVQRNFLRRWRSLTTSSDSVGSRSYAHLDTRKRLRVRKLLRMRKVSLIHKFRQIRPER